jgi:Fic family protein
MVLRLFKPSELQSETYLWRMSKQLDLYIAPEAMEPLFPDDPAGTIDALATELLEKIAALNATTNAITRDAIASFLGPVSGYYTGVLEAEEMSPADVISAYQNQLSGHPKTAEAQLKLIAEKAVLGNINSTLADAENDEIPASAGFLKSIHNMYFSSLTEAANQHQISVGTIPPTRPGEYRDIDLMFGKFWSPYFGSLPFFMSEFENAYDPGSKANKSKIRRIINIAVAHQRLSWIQPFSTDNQRLVRLYAEACIRYENLNPNGLWSLARGLARNKTTYFEKLENAGLKRLNAMDGRGNLSNKYLVEFCIFYLNTALGQVKFMLRTLETENMLKRINNFVDLMVSRGNMRSEAKYLLTDVFLKGKISKPDAMRITGTSDKTLKLITDDLIEKQLLTAKKEGIVMMYYVQYPVVYAPLLFPGLFPADKEIEMMEIF